MIRKTATEIKQKKLIKKWKLKNRKLIIVKAVKKTISTQTKEIKSLRKKTYKEFLKSEYWSNVRKKILARDEYKCRNCGSKNKLEVHHTTYKNHFKEHNNLQDLRTLCRPCHCLVHSI